MINLNEVGVFDIGIHGDEVQATFGVYLPGIRPEDGYEVAVRVIHKEDRFRPDIAPQDFNLAPVAGAVNNLWQGQATIHPQADTQFGRPGSYLYRYQLRQGQN